MYAKDFQNIFVNLK